MSARSKPKKRNNTTKSVKLGRHGKMRESFKDLKQDIETKIVPVVTTIAQIADEATKTLSHLTEEDSLHTELKEFAETTKKDALEFGERVGQVYQSADQLSQRLPKGSGKDQRDLSFVAGASLGIEALQLTEDIKDYHQHATTTWSELHQRIINTKSTKEE